MIPDRDPDTMRPTWPTGLCPKCGAALTVCSRPDPPYIGFSGCYRCVIREQFLKDPSSVSSSIGTATLYSPPEFGL